jgi:streptomycin 3"-adenylyltransferase
VSQTDDVVEAARDVLGLDVLGAYLHGSAVLGRMQPRSDIDVLVVTRRRTTTAQRRRLVKRLLAVSGRRAPYPEPRPVELTVVAQPEVRPWRYPPRVEMQYGEWLRADFEAGRIPQPGPSPDLAVLVTMALTADRTVYGPPPGEVLDRVPTTDLRRALVEVIPGLLLDLEPDTANVLLTLARI